MTNRTQHSDSNQIFTFLFSAENHNIQTCQTSTIVKKKTETSMERNSSHLMITTQTPRNFPEPHLERDKERRDEKPKKKKEKRRQQCVQKEVQDG